SLQACNGSFQGWTAHQKIEMARSKLVMDRSGATTGHCNPGRTIARMRELIPSRKSLIASLEWPVARLDGLFSPCNEPFHGCNGSSQSWQAHSNPGTAHCKLATDGSKVGVRVLTLEGLIASLDEAFQACNEPLQDCSGAAPTPPPA